MPANANPPACAAFLFGLFLVGLVTQPAAAQTWTGGGDGVSWNQAANWSALPVDAMGSGIQFSTNLPLMTTQNIGSPFSLGNLTANGTGSLIIDGSGLDFNRIISSGSVLTANSAGVLINVPVNLTSNLAVSNNGSGTTTLSGGLSGMGKLSTYGGTTTLSGPGTWTGGTGIGTSSSLRIAAADALAGAVNLNSGTLEFATPGASTFNNILSGEGTVRQAGPGTVMLTGNSSSWNGGYVRVAAGKLQVGHVNALGGVSGGAYMLTGGTLELAVNDGLTPARSEIFVDAGGTLDLGGFQQTTPVRVINQGTISLPAGSFLAAFGDSNPILAWSGNSTGAGELAFKGGYTRLGAGSNLQHTGGTNIGTYVALNNVSNALPDVGLLKLTTGGSLSHNGTESVESMLVDGGGSLYGTAFTVTNGLDMREGSVQGNVTVNGAFTKTTSGYGNLVGVIDLNGGATVSEGELYIQGTVNGSFLNSGGVTHVIQGLLNGSITNQNVLNVNGYGPSSAGDVAGTVTNTGTLNVGDYGKVSAAVDNTGTVSFSGGGSSVTGNISGTGQFSANAANGSLTGVNSYSGGSVLTNSYITGNTDSVQGDWTINGSTLSFFQNSNGTMAGDITGNGSVRLIGNGVVTLSGDNSFSNAIEIYSSQFNVGSNAAAGTASIFGSNFKISAEGGARTLSNSFTFAPDKTEFTGSHDLTLSNNGAKSIVGTSQILHSSTATTTVGGTFLGQNTTVINVNAGKLVLGAPVNNGFRMDGAVNVASGATLEMVSNSPVKLGPTNLNGGTLKAVNGVAVPTGLALNAAGIIQGRVAMEAGAVIDATGALTMGDAASFGGFFANGELREQAQGITILDRNQAVLGNLTEIGTNSNSGVLTAANGVFVDFGRAITGWGTVAGTNAIAQASIINGDAAGTSSSQPLEFTGYVKGIGTFSDVVFDGTYSPGLSPSIVPLTNVSFGSNNTLLMEVGGLSPGSQHDQISIGGVLGLNGTLDVDLINGFNPSMGNYFQLFNGVTSGSFNSLNFPTLNPGLSWDSSDLYTLGNLKVVAMSVPEPTAVLLETMVLAVFFLRRRKASSGK